MAEQEVDRGWWKGKRTPPSQSQGGKHRDTQEPPYLTHLTRYHGAFTLTAPDNMGKRRTAKEGKKKGKPRFKIPELGPSGSTSSINKRNYDSSPTRPRTPLASTSTLTLPSDNRSATSLRPPSRSTIPNEEHDSSDSEREIIRALNASLPVAPERPSVILRREGDAGRVWMMQAERPSEDEILRRQQMTQIESHRIDIWDGIPDPLLDSEFLPEFTPSTSFQVRQVRQTSQGETEETVIPTPNSPPPTFLSISSPIHEGTDEEDSTEGRSEDDDDDGTTDPLALAWEQDRLNEGLTEQERIARDCERRAMAFLNLPEVQTLIDPSNVKSSMAEAAPTTPQQSSERIPPPVSPAEKGQSTPPMAEQPMTTTLSAAYLTVAEDNPMTSQQSVTMAFPSLGQGLPLTAAKYTTPQSDSTSLSISPTTELDSVVKNVDVSPNSTAIVSTPGEVSTEVFEDSGLQRSPSPVDASNSPILPPRTDPLWSSEPQNEEMISDAAELSIVDNHPLTDKRLSGFNGQASWRTASVLLGTHSSIPVHPTPSLTSSPLDALAAKLSHQAGSITEDVLADEHMLQTFSSASNLTRKRGPPPVPPRRRLPPEDVQDGLRRLRSTRDTRVNRMKSIFEPRINNPSILTYISSDEKAKLQNPLEPTEGYERMATLSELPPSRSVSCLISQFEGRATSVALSPVMSSKGSLLSVPSTSASPLPPVIPLKSEPPLTSPQTDIDVIQDEGSTSNQFGPASALLDHQLQQEPDPLPLTSPSSSNRFGAPWGLLQLTKEFPEQVLDHTSSSQLDTQHSNDPTTTQDLPELATQLTNAQFSEDRLQPNDVLVDISSDLSPTPRGEVLRNTNNSPPQPNPNHHISSSSEGSLEITDLDVLLSNLDEERQDEGENYEQLLTLGEMMGNAGPEHRPEDALENLLLSSVECERRRVTKEGKVKQKLTVAGVACNKCSICLTQFKAADLAYLVPGCLHTFHATCLNSWVRKGNHLCPICRKDFLKE